MIETLQCDIDRGLNYKSSTQIARVVSEHWCAENLYCAACDANRLEQASPNTRALDFRCGNCSETYQVKSQKSFNLGRVVDGAYAVMLAAAQENTAPNLVILNYGQTWNVSNLVLIPSLFFTESVIQKRSPLSVKARRAGWVGCNLVLSNIPSEGKIALVQNASIVPAALVREQYRRYKKLETLDWQARGWTLDVLQRARKIGAREFTLAQMYEHEQEVAALHPGNRNIRAKIRQQLQVLRSLGLLRFVNNRGRYEFLS